MVKISVILPVRNCDISQLKESVDSILNQTFSDFEILVIDDSDNSENKDFLESYNNPKIKIIEGDHKGIASALNKGISFAQGEFIARMDADDISMPERFEKQVDFLEKNPEISLVGTSYKKIPSGTVVSQPEKITYFDILNRCCIAHPTVMFRKKDFEKYDLKYNEEITTSEDYELWSRAVRFIEMANLKEVLLYYRIIQNSLYHSNITEVEKNNYIIRENMLKFLSNDKKQRDYIYQFVKNNRKLSFMQRIFSMYNERKNDQKWKIINILGIRLKIEVK